MTEEDKYKNCASELLHLLRYGINVNINDELYQKIYGYPYKNKNKTMVNSNAVKVC